MDKTAADIIGDLRNRFTDAVTDADSDLDVLIDQIEEETKDAVPDSGADEYAVEQYEDVDEGETHALTNNEIYQLIHDAWLAGRDAALSALETAISDAK